MYITVAPYRTPGVYVVINNDWDKYKLVIKYDDSFVRSVVVAIYSSIINGISAKI